MMIKKKFIIILFFYSFLGACTTPTAMLGPIYTISTKGNSLQAGLSFGSSKMITKYTGKTPLQNIKEFNLVNKKKNIKKKTLESEDFYALVENKVLKTNILISSSNQ